MSVCELHHPLLIDPPNGSAFANEEAVTPVPLAINSVYIDFCGSNEHRISSTKIHVFKVYDKRALKNCLY